MVMMRFRLRGLLIITTIVALILGLIVLERKRYNWQLDNLHRIVASHPEIKIVDIQGNEDLWYEVEVVTFSVGGTHRTVRFPHAASESEMHRVINDALETL